MQSLWEEGEEGEERVVKMMGEVERGVGMSPEDWLVLVRVYLGRGWEEEARGILEKMEEKARGEGGEEGGEEEQKTYQQAVAEGYLLLAHQKITDGDLSGASHLLSSQSLPCSLPSLASPSFWEEWRGGCRKFRFSPIPLEKYGFEGEEEGGERWEALSSNFIFSPSVVDPLPVEVGERGGEGEEEEEMNRKERPLSHVFISSVCGIFIFFFIFFFFISSPFDLCFLFLFSSRILPWK